MTQRWPVGTAGILRKRGIVATVEEPPVPESSYLVVAHRVDGEIALERIHENDFDILASSHRLIRKIEEQERLVWKLQKKLKELKKGRP